MADRKKEKGGKRKGSGNGPLQAPVTHLEVPQPINDFLKRRALRERRLLSESGGGTSGRGAGGRASRAPDGLRFTAWYRDLVEALQKRDLLPAIVFIFSRAGCDRAAAEIGSVANKMGLLTPAEKDQVKERLQAFRRANPQVAPLALVLAYRPYPGSLCLNLSMVFCHSYGAAGCRCRWRRIVRASCCRAWPATTPASCLSTSPWSRTSLTPTSSR